MASKKVAAKKSTGSSMVKWDEKFAKYAKETKDQTKNIGVGGLSVKFGRGNIHVGDAPVKGGVLEGVIIGSCALNRWNEAAYDPDNKQPPDCYAFALVSDDPEQAPHAAATKKQSDLCSTCEKNVFGTAQTGKGKACANTIRIGFLTAKDAEDADGIATAELAVGGVSPTNLGHYKKYTDMLADEYNRPPWAVVTAISSHDDPKTQIRLEFKMVALIEDDDVLNALEKRFTKIQDVLQKPFSAPTDKKSTSKGKTAGGNKKFAAKKSVARR